jgi:hypothetical protein
MLRRGKAHVREQLRIAKVPHGEARNQVWTELRGAAQHPRVTGAWHSLRLTLGAPRPNGPCNTISLKLRRCHRLRLTFAIQLCGNADSLLVVIWLRSTGGWLWRRTYGRYYDAECLGACAVDVGRRALGGAPSLLYQSHRPLSSAP